MYSLLPHELPKQNSEVTYPGPLGKLVGSIPAYLAHTIGLVGGTVQGSIIFPQPLPVYVARLSTARTCISLILDFLWFPEPALPMDKAGQKCQGIKAHHSPSSSL